MIRRRQSLCEGRASDAIALERSLDGTPAIGDGLQDGLVVWAACITSSGGQLPSNNMQGRQLGKGWTPLERNVGRIPEMVQAFGYAATDERTNAAVHLQEADDEFAWVPPAGPPAAGVQVDECWGGLQDNVSWVKVPMRGDEWAGRDEAHDMLFLELLAHASRKEVEQGSFKG